MKKILTIIACFLFIGSYAQKDTTIIVNLDHKKYDKKHKLATGWENTIKIAPLGFVSGTFPVLYERVINDFFTLQGGIGITSRNYYRSAVQTIGDNLIVPDYPWGSNGTYLDLADEALKINKRLPKLGFMFNLQPRIYFNDEAPDESFMGISYDFYRYNFTHPGIVKNTTGDYVYTGPSKKEYENISDAMVWFGYQDVMDNLSVEYAAGLGIRNVKGVKYFYGEDQSGVREDIEGFAPYKQTLFNFNIGIKVGYHF